MTSTLLPRHSLKSLLCFTNFLVATLALLMVSGGIILALDNVTVTNTAGIVKDVGKDFFASDITDSFEEFYSVFNKKGGWFNFDFVLTGIGAITFVVSIFGFCGVHKESHCLLVTYILLLAIMILLQTAAALLLNQRDQEMLQVVKMLGVGGDAALEVPIELALPSGEPFHVKTKLFHFARLCSFIVDIVSVSHTKV